MRTGTAGHPADGGRELTARLAAIVRSASDAIVSTTLDGIITSWNPGAMAMFGHTAEEMIAHPISVLFPPDRADELVPILDQMRRGGRVAHYETKCVRKDGTTIDVSVSISPLRTDSGVIIGAAAVARDVTERNWAEAECRESAARLCQAERMESLGRLAGTVAADFADLASDILSYCDVESEAAAGNPAMRASVQKIRTAAGRAAQLAHELLVFSRRDFSHADEVDLNAVLNGVRDLLHDSIGERVGLRLNTAPALPAVLADRGQIQYVLLNLAENARDAMPDGGTLTFTTRRMDLSKVADAEWPGSWPGQYVELAVSDTGCGMDADTMRHVFEPFFTTKPPGHAGLGLSTAYGVITRAGGGITIDSEEGKGTTFHIFLPAHLRAPASPARLLPGGQEPGETILVVDDRPAVLEITARILRHNGYRTLEAGTCEEAIALMCGHDVQLLLTGTAMPETPGQALADRALEMQPGIPILRMPDPLPEGVRPEPVASADTPLIRKPFTAQELLGKVRAALTTKPET